MFQVDIPMSVLYKCASSMDSCDVNLLDKKWAFLQNLDLVSDDGTFILGVNGVLTEAELEMTLKVGNLKNLKPSSTFMPAELAFWSEQMTLFDTSWLIINIALIRTFIQPKTPVSCKTFIKVSGMYPGSCTNLLMYIDCKVTFLSATQWS